jgi:xanthine dehydrogenase accessory factor
VVRGGGDLATAVAVRLWRAGLRLLVLELREPRAVRRGVAFAEAVYAGQTAVEGVPARRIAGLADLDSCWRAGAVPVLVDPHASCLAVLRPTVLVDARMAKQPLDTRRDQAPVVIGLGPGFTAGEDADAVVETQRGHGMGRVIWEGAADPDTGVPAEIAGHAADRVLRSPVAGRLEAVAQIGDRVEAGQVVARVDGVPIRAAFVGVVRGLLHPSVALRAGDKVGDVDPRARIEHCWTVSDKGWAVAGGVLEAALALWPRSSDAATAAAAGRRRASPPPDPVPPQPTGSPGPGKRTRRP